MSGFVLPATFVSRFEKQFVHKNVHFTIKIQEMGLREEKPWQAPYLLWHYAIFVNRPEGNFLVETGPFRHDPSDRVLTLENVANNLASFYEDSVYVQHPEKSREILVEQVDLEEIIYKCASYMLTMLVTEVGPPDYDILVATLGVDGDWHVMLETPLMPERLFDFNRKFGANPMVATYIKANSIHAQL